MFSEFYLAQRVGIGSVFLPLLLEIFPFLPVLVLSKNENPRKCTFFFLPTQPLTGAITSSQHHPPTPRHITACFQQRKQYPFFILQGTFILGLPIQGISGLTFSYWLASEENTVRDGAGTKKSYFFTYSQR